MFTWFQNILDSLSSLYTDLATAMNSFNTELWNLIQNINNFTSGGDSPIRVYIGMFRFAVGDLIFMLYYVIALFGCFYTLYRLINGIYKTIGNAKLNAFKYIKP